MKNNQETTQAPQELLNDLRSLMAEAEKMLGDSASQPAADALGNLRLRYDAAQERLGEMYQVTKRRVVEGAKCTDAAIRANPYQSIAIAAGAGLLLGVLLGRRSH